MSDNLNLGFMYTKGFYRDEGDWREKPELSQDELKKKTSRIIEFVYGGSENGFVYPEDVTKNSPIGVSVQNFKLMVSPPGLYVGIGYEHGLSDDAEKPEGKDKVSDFRNGFSFDYTTGLPYIPGSGVKGALWAAFDGYPGDILKECFDEQHDADWLAALTKCVFGEPDNQGKVIFYDAFPVAGVPNKLTKVVPVAGVTDTLTKEVTDEDKGRLMGTDYVTPHKSEGEDRSVNDLFVEPRPLRMLKLLPGVKLRFCFGLPEQIEFQLKPEKEEQTEGERQIVSGKDLLEVFKKTLMRFGIGAKTSEGYGYLIEPKDITKTYIDFWKRYEAYNQGKCPLCMKGDRQGRLLCSTCYRTEKEKEGCAICGEKEQNENNPKQFKLLCDECFSKLKNHS